MGCVKAASSSEATPWAAGKEMSASDPAGGWCAGGVVVCVLQGKGEPGTQ